MTTTGSPEPSNCLETTAQNCNIIGNCSGILCNAQQSGSTTSSAASVQIKERCADPIMVNMSVGPGYQRWFSVAGDGLSSAEVVNGGSVRVEYGRNPSHLHFKV